MQTKQRALKFEQDQLDHAAHDEYIEWRAELDALTPEEIQAELRRMIELTDE